MNLRGLTIQQGFAVLTCVITLAACGGGGGKAPAPLLPQTIEAGGDRAAVMGQAGFTQAATGGLGTGSLSYTSSNPSIARVNSQGQVALVGQGTTRITVTKAADARYSQASDSYSLTVNRPPYRPVVMNNIALSSQAANAELRASQSLTLSLENPDNIMSLTLTINDFVVHEWVAADLQPGTQELTYLLTEAEISEIFSRSQVQLTYRLTASQLEGQALVMSRTVSRTRPTLRYTANEFAPSRHFDQVCAQPRTGNDRHGRPWPDQQGTTLHEKYWIRSFSFETYLWHDELTDLDPASIDNKITYFDRLRTNAAIRPGKRKDRHHWTRSTEYWESLQNADPKASYGIESIGKTIRNVWEGFPAAKAGLKRGDVILAVDPPAGWARPEDGATHTFTIQDRDSGLTRRVTMMASLMSRPSVQDVRVLETDNGNVGYLSFYQFNYPAERQLAAAIKTLKAGNVRDLVVDMRYNGGGTGSIAAELGYMIAGAQPGRTFVRWQHNGKLDQFLAPYLSESSNDPLARVPFIASARGFSLTRGEPLPTLELNRVFVLSTLSTCSASEAFINGFRGVDGLEVILIGSKTCGKPHGFFVWDNCGTSYATIQVAVVNDKDFGLYDDGFYPANANAPYGVSLPGCQVADVLSHDLGDPKEPLLAAALQYRQDASCPTLVQASSYAASHAQDEASGAVPAAMQKELESMPQDEWQGLYFDFQHQ